MGTEQGCHPRAPKWPPQLHDAACAREPTESPYSATPVPSNQQSRQHPLHRRDLPRALLAKQGSLVTHQPDTSSAWRRGKHRALLTTLVVGPVYMPLHQPSS